MSIDDVVTIHFQFESLVHQDLIFVFLAVNMIRYTISEVIMILTFFMFEGRETESLWLLH